MTQPLLCIGSVLWDIIGRTYEDLGKGADVPGRIVRDPGGVALNIAMGVSRYHSEIELLTAVGKDPEGDELINIIRQRGIGTRHIYRPDDLRTDCYMAIEGHGQLVAAIADAHSLESVGDKILTPLLDGRLGSVLRPFDGVAALDGNLTEQLLNNIADGPWLSAADLRVVPASPGKVQRLRPLLTSPRATIYLNCIEAGLLLGQPTEDAAKAATALTDQGVRRVVVTNGPREAAMAADGKIHTALPPEVTVRRVTGAGDSFMAAHMHAEMTGEGPEAALVAGLTAASKFISAEAI
ncbi:PfkB family carbohydrate kinase [Palleronia caenipelagi]|uniref:Kinase n=1 Tax=Palleronia caenipelagi TaxID=2489174 RepID=A0A547Q5Z0_9RHOB|nr:PfkB family carbohydrate kinase [Palleronia caenipelagi]TRD21799.1 kinase [Palleronia caenipelagi]